MDQEEGASQSSKSLGSKAWAIDRSGLALAVLLVAAVAYWLWYGLTIRILDIDDGISLLAVQGILEHGYPRLPSGFLYDRAYLPNYLIAASVGVFGLNNWSIMLPSLLMGLGSLFLVYRIAKDALGRPWVGVAAAAILVTLQLQTWYSTGPRMYMALQFFTLLAVYGVWRGHVQGAEKYKLLAVVSIAAGMLSLVEGVILVASLPAAAMGVMLLKGQEWSEVFTLKNLISVVALAVLAVLLLLSPPNAFPGIVAHFGLGPERAGPNFGLVYWSQYPLNFERVFPFGLALLPIAYFVSARTLWQRTPSTNYGPLYLMSVFSASALTLGFLIYVGGAPRLLFFILPVYVLGAVLGGAVLAERLGLKARKPGEVPEGDRLAVFLLLLVGTAISIGFTTLEQSDDYTGGSLVNFAASAFQDGLKVTGLIKEGYGIPCPKESCEASVREVYDDLRRAIGPHDMIVSNMPFRTNYYLGRVDAWVVERKTRTGEHTFFDSPTDEYFGIPIIDTEDELEGLRLANTRVWIIAGHRQLAHSSQTTRDLLGTFPTYLESDTMTVYVNRLPE